MATGSRQPRFSDAELARKGEEIYERDIFPNLAPEDQGKVVAIEVETGDYEVGRDEIATGDRLRSRHPEALFWFRRVGSRYLYRFGHHRGTAA
jgi:hypothetical protein